MPAGRVILIAAAVLLAAVALTGVYYVMFGEFTRDSDQVNTFLMAQDLVSGNLLGRNWRISGDNFWTSDVSFEALLIALLGVHAEVMIIAPAALWAGVVIMSVLACLGKKDWSLTGLLSTITLLGLPMLRQNDPMNLIGRSPIHIASIIYMMAMMFLAARLLKAPIRPLQFILLGCITALGVSSDPLIMVVGSASIAVVVVLDALDGLKRQHAVLLTTVTAATLAGHIGIGVVAKVGGLSAAHITLRFVEFKDLGNNLWIGLFSLFLLTGSNVFGRTVVHALPFVVRLPFLGLLVWSIVSAGSGYVRNALGFGAYRRLKPLDRILLVAVAVNIAAGLLSDLLHAPAECRYFFPALVFGSTLCARTLPASRRLNVAATAALLCGLTFTARDYIRRPPVVSALEPSVVQLADRLVSEKLVHGYASYWSASVTTAASRNQVMARAIEVDDAGRIVPKLWNSKTDWYDNFGGSRPFFVLADKWDIEAKLSDQPIVNTFGKPTRRIDMPAFDILVYE